MNSAEKDRPLHCLLSTTVPEPVCRNWPRCICGRLPVSGSDARAEVFTRPDQESRNKARTWRAIDRAISTARTDQMYQTDETMARASKARTAAINCALGVPPDLEGDPELMAPSTAQVRLRLLLEELEKRFPLPKPHTSGSLPDTYYLSQIDLLKGKP